MTLRSSPFFFLFLYKIMETKNVNNTFVRRPKYHRVAWSNRVHKQVDAIVQKIYVCFLYFKPNLDVKHEELTCFVQTIVW